MFSVRNIAPGGLRGSHGRGGLSARQLCIYQKSFRRGVVSAFKARGTQSITGLIKHDHSNLETYYNSIIKSNDLIEQVRFQNQFIWELARHTVGEELVLDPALETYVERGREIVAKDRLQHDKIRTQLFKFQQLKPDDSNFAITIIDLFKDLKAHIAEEEQDLIKLEAAIEDEHSERLAKSFQRTKLFVPTRVHSEDSAEPQFQSVVDLLNAPLDRLQDAFRKFPEIK